MELNENLHISINVKLRDSIHDIMISDLNPGEEMTLIELSEKLKDFNITISPENLKILIFDNWWKDKDYSIFREKDKKWLDLWPNRKTVELKKKIGEPPLGKSRRKIKLKEKKPINYYYGNNYNYDYYNKKNKSKTPKSFNDFD